MLIRLLPNDHMDPLWVVVCTIYGRPFTFRRDIALAHLSCQLHGVLGKSWRRLRIEVMLGFVSSRESTWPPSPLSDVEDAPKMCLGGDGTESFVQARYGGRDLVFFDRFERPLYAEFEPRHITTSRPVPLITLSRHLRELHGEAAFGRVLRTVRFERAARVRVSCLCSALTLHDLASHDFIDKTTPQPVVASARLGEATG